MNIYLDNCCFNRPFDSQIQLKIFLETQAKLEIQKLIKQGKYNLVWSYILEYENIMNPFDIRKNSIIKWKDIAGIKVVENKFVIYRAKQLNDIGIKTKDALHIACAEYAKCRYFITTDRLLLNKEIGDIEIINPINFIIKEVYQSD